MKRTDSTVIYYARSYEIRKGRQSTLFPELKSHDSKYMPITVPASWITGSGSNIVTLFHKTGKDIVCPHFWELKAYVGCPFKCSYCYLQGTFRGAERKMPKMKKEEDVKRYMEEFLTWADNVGLVTLLNTGELADSLAMPDLTKKFIEIAIPILRRHPDHKVLFLSKGGTNHVKVLEDIPKDMRERFIVSFSLNPRVVVDMYERGTADADSRIEAAEIASKMGFEVRIRIDPIIPVSNWIFHYTELVKKLLDRIMPEIITLGSLRALEKTIHYALDKSWLDYVKEKSPWGKRLRTKHRERIYKLIIEVLREKGFNGKIGLCKETPDVWNYLKSERLIEDPGTPGIWENVMCNCKLSDST